MDNLYDTDFYRWKEQQKQHLIHKRFDQLDLERVIEEFDDMGSELDALQSRLTTLLLHLLKYSYQINVINPVLPEPYNCRNWKGTIREQRKQLHRLMKNRPHLKHKVPEVFEDSYQDGKELAIEAMNDYVQPHQRLNNASFPENCPWGFETIMKSGWLPED
ncbi:DUF29 domain-containing protein [Endozoicomonas euniceicola]|uniref:DUF29 domain-containing protein n=1 Tax=Endozoicomonas euniceicola TaxID=1234143 RepID=A0ABY6H098_9GAMM|nr:DUF29 domain-containing protein [Endozoicomonas euniceicola]UYM18468.1 DUF29 domain-containing protein [Endozoicomonas euniceicola]